MRECPPRRSADLIRRLLTFARKQAIVLKVLDLNETVAGMLKMLQRLIGENIDLAWIPAKNSLPVKMDNSEFCPHPDHENHSRASGRIWVSELAWLQPVTRYQK